MVSVVIAAYGSAEYLNCAIRSVLEQSYKDYELIVVDDCSAPEIVAGYQIPKSATFISHEKRRGCGAAGRNTGIAAAKGKYVAFLDVDDAWFPHKLQAQVDLLESNPHAGLAYCQHVLADKDLRPLAHQDKPRIISKEPLRQMIIGCFIHAPSTVMMRRDVLLELGGFDTGVIANDWDLWIRTSAGYPLVSDPNPGTIYRIHPQQMSVNRVRMHDGTIAVLEKTLLWAQTEHPELVKLIKARICRVLRRQSLAQMQSRNGSDAVRSLRKAVRIWPWNPRTYGLLARACLGCATAGLRR